MVWCRQGPAHFKRGKYQSSVAGGRQEKTRLGRLLGGEWFVGAASSAAQRPPLAALAATGYSGLMSCQGWEGWGGGGWWCSAYGNYEGRCLESGEPRGAAGLEREGNRGRGCGQRPQRPPTVWCILRPAEAGGSGSGALSPHAHRAVIGPADDLAVHRRQHPHRVRVPLRLAHALQRGQVPKPAARGSNQAGGSAGDCWPQGRRVCPAAALPLPPIHPPIRRPCSPTLLPTHPAAHLMVVS